jgi:glutamyl-tRNA synthetase
MNITHVIRGEEWLSSSPKHVLIYQAFGWELPIFAHLPVIRNKDHSKMSKRKNDVSILSHRDRGYLPEAINNFLALMGWSHPDKLEVFSFADFLKLFSLERITLTAPVYDLDKLNWLNGQYIRKLTDAELLDHLSPFTPSDCSSDLVKQIIPLIKERLVTLKDFEGLTEFFYREPTKIIFEKPDQAYLAVALSILSECDWTKEGIESQLLASIKEHNWKNGPFFAALRLAITGKKISPPLSESMLILGRDKVLARLATYNPRGCK